MLLGFVVAVVLLFVASGMAVWHMKAWRQAQGTLHAQEQVFAAKQYRRRLRTAGLLAVLAILIAVGQVIPPSILALCYWFGVTLLVLWVALLGVADVLLSHRHYDELSRNNLVQQAVLRAEIDRLKREAAARPAPPADTNGAHG